MKPFILVAVSDLIFAMKIRSTLTAAKIEMVLVKTPEELAAELDSRLPFCVIIDLEAGGADPKSWVSAARRAPGDQAAPRTRILAYCPHVRTDLISQATEAGADSVVPRSRFSAELASLVQQVIEFVDGDGEELR